MMLRPNPSEYHEYYRRYVDLVPEGPILATLDRQLQETVAFLERIPATMGGTRYAPGKWSIQDVVAHVIDTERIFGYRALCMARGDQTPLPSFEQDDYVASAGAANRSLADMTEEFRLVRRSHLAMFHGFPPEAWTRHGTASGRPFSVRSFPFLMAGHVLHHRTVLEERYVKPLVGGDRAPSGPD